jgi:aldehyde:ferredoxin oxidoreductase
MYGNFGRILRIDLTREKFTVNRVKDSFFKKYLGGVGIASKIIFDNVGKNVSPLDPDNILVFAVGPFQGTGIPGSGKWTVSARSPLTGIWGDSCGGGYWGPEFKKCGFDAVAIEGRASSPVYVWINDGQIEIKNAEGIWGKKISEADKMIKEHLYESKARSVLIGPAGERLVKFACIASDHGFAGRTGLGAVMGAKNLKAVAVRGTNKIEIAEYERFKIRNGELSKMIYEATSEFRKYGTTAAAKELHDTRGYGLAKNWRKGEFEKIGELSGDSFLGITANPIACSSCPIACHRHTKVEQPEKYAFEGYGPEYETIGMIGWLNMISEPEAVAYAGHLCDEYGLDTITTGSLIGFTFECYEKGWLQDKDLDGAEAEWGSSDVAISLIHKIANRDGFGDVLAEGVKIAAETLGGDAHKIVAHVKGLDLPAHDPRGFISMAINYATGPRGACHQRGFVLQDSSKIPEWGIPETNDVYSQKNPIIAAARYQDWAEVFNSLVQCEYMTIGGLSLNHQIELLNYVTGWSMNAGDLMKTAERIFTLQRLINVRYGVSRKDDTIPPKLFEPLKEGVNAGKTPVTFEDSLRKYYKIRGWDTDGKPTVKKVVELNLTEALKLQI